MTTVTVTERKRRELTAIERKAVEGEDAFWNLVDAGYFWYRRSGRDAYEIVAHKYVGRALAGELEIRIEEKAPGTLLALVAAATGAEIRIIKSSHRRRTTT